MCIRDRYQRRVRGTIQTSMALLSNTSAGYAQMGKDNYLVDTPHRGPPFTTREYARGLWVLPAIIPLVIGGVYLRECRNESSFLLIVGVLTLLVRAIHFWCRIPDVAAWPSGPAIGADVKVWLLLQSMLVGAMVGGCVLTWPRMAKFDSQNTCDAFPLLVATAVATSGLFVIVVVISVMVFKLVRGRNSGESRERGTFIEGSSWEPA
eukprot:TRINITY_DN38165_c0_g1_i2.p1 TRINITY_DN38165_c0_g1~~TRINITY_DN38165_c0_g1_i2.p1  ORF type:complete len:207 (+),score=26.54 TRINITY_DN38165_c0_g1_i2:102-722(+)